MVSGEPLTGKSDIDFSSMCRRRVQDLVINWAKQANAWWSLPLIGPKAPRFTVQQLVYGYLINYIWEYAH